MKVGTDIEQVSRFEDKKERFFEKYFTENEIEYAKKFAKYAERFAGFFCAKESFLKCLDYKIDGLSLNEVEVCHKANGMPYIILHGEVKKIAEGKDIKNIELSISHCETHATAVVIVC